VALAAVPSSLLSGVTAHLSTDVASFPLLWVVPLAIYLLTFVLAFAGGPLVGARHAAVARALPLPAAITVLLLVSEAEGPLWLLLLVNLATFGLCAMLCHGALWRARPAPERLTEFYLLLSLGGVLGGAFNALLAPLLFPGFVEYPLMLVVACLFRPPVLGEAPGGAAGEGPVGGVVARAARGLLPAALLGGLTLALSRLAGKVLPDGGNLAVALVFLPPLALNLRQLERPARYALGLGAVLAASVAHAGATGRVVHRARSFHGVHRVTVDAAGRWRQLVDGNTVHGAQAIDPALRRVAGGYYHREGPLGAVLREHRRAPAGRAVAVVGLGAGAMAAHARPGEPWRFFELDPQVVQIARDARFFTFLDDAFPAGEALTVTLGDARLRLAEAPDRAFGLLVLDAFSGDAIPTHLLVREAMALYLRKLAPGGLLAAHISNRYLALAPVIGALGRDAGLEPWCWTDADIEARDAAEGKLASQWCVMSSAPRPALSSPPWEPAPAGAPLWTDDEIHLLAALSWGRLRRPAAIEAATMHRTMLAALVALAAGALAAGCKQRPPGIPSWNQPLLPGEQGEGAEAETEAGRIKGSAVEGARAFRGIPYAAPPVGPLRFRPPSPAVPWSGVREAQAYGACCPQKRDGGGVEGDEDCLSLNVFTPAGAGPSGAPRPVMVFLHGGANTRGCSAQVWMGERIYGGERLAAAGDVVVVTLNYRLGVLGFLAHPAIDAEEGQRSAGNFGLLDQQAALAWVQRNIAAFGGDPSRVMLLGDSAGALDVCAHLVSPGAAGLFHRALMGSGACPHEAYDQASAGALEVAKAAGCGAGPGSGPGAAPAQRDGAACLRAAGAGSLVSIAPGATFFERGVQFGPVVDGRVLPAAPIEIISAGKHNHVPLAIGANADETRLWARNMTLGGELGFRTRVRALVGERGADQVLARYPLADYPDARTAFIAAMTDAFFTCPARTLARAVASAQQEPVYRYVFANRPDRVKRGGTSQELEQLFLFDHLRPAGYVPSREEQALSTSMIGYWSRLAHAGDPNGPGIVAWPRYEPAHEAYLGFDDVIAPAPWPREPNCDFWGALLPR
jgi:carboxylesterase type B